MAVSCGPQAVSTPQPPLSSLLYRLKSHYDSSIINCSRFSKSNLDEHVQTGSAVTGPTQDQHRPQNGPLLLFMCFLSSSNTSSVSLLPDHLLSELMLRRGAACWSHTQKKVQACDGLWSDTELTKVQRTINVPVSDQRRILDMQAHSRRTKSLEGGLSFQLYGARL